MSEPTQKPMVLATLLLERPSEVDAAVLEERLGQVLDISFAQKEMLVCGGEMVALLNLGVPYPADLSGPARFAHWWPTAQSDIARHQAHLMVAAGWSRHSRLEAHLRHALLVRELIEHLPVVGVLWGSVLTPLNNFKGEFAAAQQGTIPLLLWILIQYSQQPNGNALISTVGMRDFGLMEIETESSLPMQDTYDIVRQVAGYLITQDRRIADGDTITAEPRTDRITVRHRRSFRPDVNDAVLWLELTTTPTVKKPAGFFSRMFGSGSKH